MNDFASICSEISLNSTETNIDQRSEHMGQLLHSRIIFTQQFFFLPINPIYAIILIPVHRSFETFVYLFVVLLRIPVGSFHLWVSRTFIILDTILAFRKSPVILKHTIKQHAIFPINFNYLTKRFRIRFL